MKFPSSTILALAAAAVASSGIPAEALSTGGYALRRRSASLGHGEPTSSYASMEQVQSSKLQFLAAAIAAAALLFGGVNVSVLRHVAHMHVCSS